MLCVVWPIVVLPNGWRVEKSINRAVLGVDLIKTFGVNLILLFCKLGPFINVSNFVALLWKDLAYKKECVKKFCEIDSWGQCYKTIAVIIHGKLLRQKTLLFLGFK